MEEVMNGILIREVETKNIMTKSSLPVGGYSVMLLLRQLKWLVAPGLTPAPVLPVMAFTIMSPFSIRCLASGSNQCLLRLLLYLFLLFFFTDCIQTVDQLLLVRGF